MRRAAQGIFEQALADASAMLTSVNGQTSQHHDRNLMLVHAFGDPRCRLLMINASNGRA
jgi:hypothetical protein